MEFISTKGMTNDTAPKGTVLVKYLEPSFGYWFLQYGMAYYDNPNDYEDPKNAEGWKHDNTGNKLNVIAYCLLPQINQDENPLRHLSQEKTKEKFGTFTPNMGCIGCII